MSLCTDLLVQKYEKGGQTFSDLTVFNLLCLF